MTLQEINKRVQSIKNVAEADAEAAHQLESALREDFIISMSKSSDKSLKEKAEAVLSTNGISFSRWFA